MTDLIADPRVQELVKRVKLVEVFPPPVGRPALMPVVEIRMRDGKSYSMERQHPIGFSQRPLSKDMIVDKFRDNVAYSVRTSTVLPREKGEEIVALINNLEAVDDVSQIIELGYCPSVGYISLGISLGLNDAGLGEQFPDFCLRRKG